MREESDQSDLHREARDEAFLVLSDLSELTDCCLSVSRNCPPASHLTSLDKFSGQVSEIREILARRQYKVVFLGRTSSGKSTLINALLGERVLPTGLGQTTACFIQVEGTSSSHPSLLTPLGHTGTFTQTRLDTAQDITAVLSSLSVTEDSLVILQWPRARCPLLAEDVILLDSPGLDVTSHHDHWIDHHCQDADIFVLVANAESTVMMREKQFFVSVAASISSPNIVIIENRWDCAEWESEEMMESVKEQHLERCSHFLSEELGQEVGADMEDLRARVFFTSGKEMLRWRTEESQLGAEAEPSRQFRQRKEDFAKFEESLLHHLTRSSLHTKYWTHCNSARNISQQLSDIMAALADQTAAREKTLQAEVESMKKLIEEYSFEMENITADLREEIRRMMEKVIQRISVVFHEEINNLNFLMKDFKLRYSQDDVVNMVYFQEMEKFLEKGLETNMKNRISYQIISEVQETQGNMVLQIKEKFPDFQEDFSSLSSKYPPEISFCLTTNSCEDFHYDGTFQFSYGLFYWAREYRGMMARMFPHTGDSSLGLAGAQANLPALSKLAFFLVASQNTMSGLLAGSLVCRSVQGSGQVRSGHCVYFRRVWLRVGALVLSSHGLLYLYERLLWLSGGREKDLKRKFVAHFQARMRLMIHTVTGSVRQQIQKVSEM